MKTVVIADDHQLVREGIRALLDKQPDIEVVGEAADGVAAVALVKKLAPDFVIMDLAMPKQDGLQATRQVRKLGGPTEVIILSMHARPAFVQQALRRGARAYLLKSAISEELMAALAAAEQGETYLRQAVREGLQDNWLSLQDDTGSLALGESLTERERQVLQLIAEGHTNNEIAALLTVTAKTVSKHRTSLMAKLDVHDLPGLMRAAIKHNLIFVS